MAHRDGPGPSTGPEETSPQPGEPLNLRPLRRRPVAAFATGVLAGAAGAVLVIVLVFVVGPRLLDRVQDGVDATVGDDAVAEREAPPRGSPSTAPTTSAPATTQPVMPTVTDADSSTTSVPEVAELPRLGRSLAGRRVAAVGDSLLESVDDALTARLAPAEVDIDAQQSRPVQGGIAPLRRLTDGGADIVVVALGTNDVSTGLGFESAVEEVLEAAGDAECILWVDVQEFRPELETVNEVIHEVAAAHGVTVVEWSEVAGPSELHGADGYHLSPAGRTAFADLIADGVRDCPPPGSGPASDAGGGEATEGSDDSQDDGQQEDGQQEDGQQDGTDGFIYPG